MIEIAPAGLFSGSDVIIWAATACIKSFNVAVMETTMRRSPTSVRSKAVALGGVLACSVASTLAMLAPAVAHETTAKGVTVAHPWARATPGGATVAAAYMEIKTANGVTDKLISAQSPVAGRVEVHTHIMDGDVMKMRKVDAVDLSSGESKVLKPGGDHIMLFDLKQPLKEGDLVKLTLMFEKAGAIEVEGSVEPVGAMGPHGMSEQPTDASTKAGAETGTPDHSSHGHH